MSEQDNGRPAFPQFEVVSGERDGHGDAIEAYTVATGGMTLRDWFAGQALAGILAGGFADTIPHDDVTGGSDAAFFAYQYADAMLAESARAQGGDA